MKGKSSRILIHLVAVFAFLSLPLLFSPGPFDSMRSFANPFLRRDYVAYFMLIGFFYLNYYLLIPELYLKRRYILFSFILLFCFLTISINAFVFVHLNIHPGGPGPKPPGANFLFEMGHLFFHFVAVVFISLTLKINSKWKESQREKISAELAYLKAQINPHFLFNTLNTIYSLSIDKSDQTPEAIVKLSGLMRYVITDANEEFVPLEKEIGYVSDYIDLQAFRLGNTVKISYSRSGDYTGKMIAPLLLIPFIENAFKFGVNAESKSMIIINIELSGDDLLLYISNSKINIADEAGNRGKLGVETTVNRLNLLYPSAYSLMADDQEDSYSVTLKLNLK